MALLDPTHPLIQEFKLRMQALALLRRMAKRLLTEEEEQQVAGNTHLAGLDRTNAQQRKEYVVKNEKAISAIQSKLGPLAAQLRTQQAAAQHADRVATAHEQYKDLPLPQLLAKRLELAQLIDAAQNDLKLVVTAIRVREKEAEIKRKEEALQREKDELAGKPPAQTLDPAGIQSTTVVSEFQS
jgi:hypothetical protein